MNTFPSFSIYFFPIFPMGKNGVGPPKVFFKNDTLTLSPIENFGLLSVILKL